MLGVEPQLGRTFTPAEDEPGHDVVVISDPLWRRRFGPDPAAASWIPARRAAGVDPAVVLRQE